MKTIAFTGYRLEKLPFAEDMENEQYNLFRKKLKQVISHFIEKGYSNFISGMAVGFDMWAAEDVISMKKDNSAVNLECAIPFPEQDRKWLPEDKARRKKIINQADLVTVVCEHYHKSCFFMRNEYMVDKAEIIICCFDGQKGGTAQTVAYAKRKNKIIVQINPNDLSVSVINGCL